MANTNIQHRITLFGQPTNMTCWSAATTMLFGDRSIGSGTASVGSSGGLNSNYNNMVLFATAHNLTLHAPQSWTVQGLTNLLQRGPFVMAGRVPSGHAFVIAGINTDGTPLGTVLTIYDPWPPNTGKKYTVIYSQFMNKYPMASMYVLQR